MVARLKALDIPHCCGYTLLYGFDTILYNDGEGFPFSSDAVKTRLLRHIENQLKYWKEDKRTNLFAFLTYQQAEILDYSMRKHGFIPEKSVSNPNSGNTLITYSCDRGGKRAIPNPLPPPGSHPDVVKEKAPVKKAAPKGWASKPTGTRTVSTLTGRQVEMNDDGSTVTWDSNPIIGRIRTSKNP